MKQVESKMVSITLAGVTMLVGTMLASIKVMADESIVDEINITVPVSCTISGTGMTSHNATINNGIYTADIGSTILHAFCNDNNGLAIYAAGFTGNEVGGTNSNKLVGTANSNNAVIETGLATTAGNPDISNWAMKLTVTQDSGDTTGTNAFVIDSAQNLVNGTLSGSAASFANYHTVPNEYTKVAHKNSGTDMTTSTGGVKLTTTYAAYISKTQPADTYSGQVIYTLVHPASHAAPVFLNPNADDISEVNYMQQFAIVSDENRQAIIDSMTPEQQYTVLDSRDGKSYTIAKYQTGVDSNTNDPIYDVWMTKNLDLDLDSTRTYTNEDTDLGYNTTTGQYTTASWTPTSSTMTSSNASWTMSTATPESYDPGNLYWNGTESDYSDWDAYYNSCTEDPSTNMLSNCNENLNPLSTYASSTGTTQYHLGNYYNWTAALATNDSSSYENDDLVEQSICPAGWTLPRVGQGEDTFYALWNQYGFANTSFDDTDNDEVHDAGEDALWTNPLYFSASGFFDGVLGGVGSGGVYWSPVAYGSYGARGASFGVGGYPYPSLNYDRGGGNSVRCVARPSR